MTHQLSEMQPSNFHKALMFVSVCSSVFCENTRQPAEHVAKPLFVNWFKQYRVRPVYEAPSERAQLLLHPFSTLHLLCSSQIKQCSCSLSSLVQSKWEEISDNISPNTKVEGGGRGLTPNTRNSNKWIERPTFVHFYTIFQWDDGQGLGLCWWVMKSGIHDV